MKLLEEQMRLDIEDARPKLSAEELVKNGQSKNHTLIHFQM